MSLESKYLQMLEEKTELFRTIQAKKEILHNLDNELSQLRMQSLESKHNAASSKRSRVSNIAQTEFEEIGVDQNTLVPWTTILKETHGTGTLSSMTKAQKDRIDDSVLEFLSLHMHPSDIRLCKVSVGKKTVAALPQSMTEPFQNWLGEICCV